MHENLEFSTDEVPEAISNNMVEICEYRLVFELYFLILHLHNFCNCKFKDFICQSINYSSL